jgi:hypothetical protein
MANTYVKIGSTVTVGAGGAASIDFTSIPSTYTDLIIKISSRSSDVGSATGIVMQFNGSSASLTYKQLSGQGTGVASYSGSTGRISATDGAGATASTFGNAEVYIPNYAGSANKSSSIDGVQENNASVAYADLTAYLWSNTAAITSISLSLQAGNFVQYSTATLYGISKS